MRMNVLQFTIPVPGGQNIILKEEAGPHFYPHLHRHDEIQLTWIQKGEGTLVVNNGMHSFRSNEIYCIGANRPHVFKSDPSYFNPESKQEIKALTVFFNPNGKLKSVFELFELKAVNALLQKFSSGFAVPEKYVAQVSSAMTNVFHKTGAGQMVCFIELLSLLTGIPALKKLSQQDELSVANEKDGLRISNIYHYVLMNFDKPIKLEEVSAKANMTTPAFCRYFKKRTLKTFVSFLNEVRINEACNRLTQQNFDSIATVAYTCGFNSITHFYRVFKSVAGQSPSEYLQAYASKAHSFAHQY